MAQKPIFFFCLWRFCSFREPHSSGISDWSRKGSSRDGIEVTSTMGAAEAKAAAGAPRDRPLRDMNLQRVTQAAAITLLKTRFHLPLPPACHPPRPPPNIFFLLLLSSSLRLPSRVPPPFSSTRNHDTLNSLFSSPASCIVPLKLSHLFLIKDIEWRKRSISIFPSFFLIPLFTTSALHNPLPVDSFLFFLYFCLL